MTDYYCENCEFFEDKSTDKLIDGYCKKYNQSLNFYDWWEKCNNCVIETLKAENAELKSSLTHANEECLKWHERAQNLLKDSGGSISGYEKKISDLQAENAALRERLDKAVELKVKIGDKVYCIHGMSNPIIIEWQVDEIRITDHNYILNLIIAGTKDYRNELSQYYGKWWFTTREAAEARLRELQGGKE